MTIARQWEVLKLLPARGHLVLTVKEITQRWNPRGSVSVNGVLSVRLSRAEPDLPDRL